jgi:hypothetical protein
MNVNYFLSNYNNLYMFYNVYLLCPYIKYDLRLLVSGRI